VDHFRPGGDKLNAHSATPSVDNPIHSAPPAVHRSSFVMRVTRRYGASAVKIHFRRIFTLKVAPVILSSIAMCTMFAGVTPVIVLPFVAFIEFVGDFLPSYFVHHAADWKEMNPSRHFLEERLGLFFMLVLGEMVLGFSAIDYSSGDENQIYKVLL
jgi:low temperature requirement protein LtrA